MTEKEYWKSQLRKLVGRTIVGTYLLEDEVEIGDRIFPCLELDDGKHVALFSDEEGNDGGRFQIVEGD